MTSLITALNRDYGSSQGFLQKMNGDMQVSTLTADAKECVFGHYPTLGQVRAAYGENTILAWIVIQLVTYQERTTIKEKLNRQQLQTLAMQILEGFFHLRISELMLFLRESLTKLRYEHFYGSIEPSIIMRNLQVFLHEVKGRMIDEHEQEQRKLQFEESLKNSITYTEWQKIKSQKQNQEKTK